MLDVETGRIVNNPVVVIEGDRIASVGGRAPRGAEVIDLGNSTLIPGLIDLHTHLAGDLEGDWVNRPVREGDADAALGIGAMAPFQIGNDGEQSVRVVEEAALLEPWRNHA